MTTIVVVRRLRIKYSSQFKIFLINFSYLSGEFIAVYVQLTFRTIIAFEKVHG